MGNYLNVASPKERDLSALKLFKKVKSQNCFQAFHEYYDKYYPRSELTYEEFDDCFSCFVNNTRKSFDKL